MRRIALLALFLTCLAPAGASGQWATGPVSSAMGGGGMVFSTGADALGLNPANLGFSRGWTLVLVDVGAAGLLTGTTLADLVDIADAGGTGNRALVDRLPEDGFRLSAMTEGYALTLGAEAADIPSPGAALPSFGLAWGSLALTVRNKVLAEAAMSREVADLTVSGFNPERIREYAVRETGFRVASFTDVTFGYGATVGSRLGLGAAVRFVQGHRLSQGRIFEPVIDLEEETLSISGVAVEAPGGSGWGLDLGAALDLGEGVRVSLAAENVLQRMSWEEALQSHSAAFSDADFDSADFSELLDRFEAVALDPEAVTLPVFEAARGLFTQAYFPTVLRAGAGWASKDTRVEINASAVAPRGRQTTPWEQRVSAGVEQRLGPLSLRAGYARAEKGITAVTGGIGIGLGPVHLDMAAGKMSGTLDGIAYDGLQGSLGVRLSGGAR